MLRTVRLRACDVRPVRCRHGPSEDVPRPPGGASGPQRRRHEPRLVQAAHVRLLWIVVFYISGGTLPIPFPSDQSSWNILIGFGIAFVGFLMTLWWR
jgi:hypothetical protein